MFKDPVVYQICKNEAMRYQSKYNDFNELLSVAVLAVCEAYNKYEIVNYGLVKQYAKWAIWFHIKKDVRQRIVAYYPVPYTYNPEELYEAKEWLDQQSDRNRRILLDRARGLWYDEIGLKEGVSKQRIHQIIGSINDRRYHKR